MSASFTERLQREHAEALPGLPHAVVDDVRRAAALQRLLDAGLPGLRDDAWRYADLRSLGRARLVPTPYRPAATAGQAGAGARYQPGA